MTSQNSKKEPQGSKVFGPSKAVAKPFKYRELNRQLSKLAGENHLVSVPGYN